jgi:hypothetical protein
MRFIRSDGMGGIVVNHKEEAAMNIPHHFQKTLCAVGAAALMALASSAAHAGIDYAYDFSYVVGGYTMTLDVVDPDNVAVDITTLYFPNYNPIDKGLGTDGVAGTVTLTETITNTGSTAWTSWSESLWNEDGTGDTGPGTPGLDVVWGTLTSSVAGTFSVDNATGLVVFNFDTALGLNETVVLTKQIVYGDGVAEIGIEEIPVPVPEASTYGMMLAGLSMVAYAARRKKAAA